PVLLRAAAYEHEGYWDHRPRPPHTLWLLRAEGSAVLDPVPEGPERATVPDGLRLSPRGSLLCSSSWLERPVPGPCSRNRRAGLEPPPGYRSIRQVAVAHVC